MWAYYQSQVYSLSSAWENSPAPVYTLTQAQEDAKGARVDPYLDPYPDPGSTLPIEPYPEWGRPLPTDPYPKQGRPLPHSPLPQTW